MEGGTLQDRLACRGSSALVPLTANERILVLSDVARGLAYLHSEVRVIHRDVKSANVLLDEGCRGRVGDFGIAKSLNDNNAGITVTHMQTERVMGTQVYMTPEYMRGELSTKVDAFAFGLVVLETLTRNVSG
jgi:interleukin-1 receptor-associated kinase 4